MNSGGQSRGIDKRGYLTVHGVHRPGLRGGEVGALTPSPTHSRTYVLRLP